MFQKQRRERAVATLGGRCIKCGFNDIRALHIDHKNGGGSRERGKNNLGWARLYKKIMQGGGRDYQLLCANCNMIKRHEEKEFSYAKEV